MHKKGILSHSILLYHITHSLFTGADKMVYRLCSGLDKRKWSATMCVQADSGIVGKAKKASVYSEVLPFPKILDVYQYGILDYQLSKKIIVGLAILHYNFKLWKLIRERKIELIFTTSFRAVLTLAPVVVFTRTPLILTLWLERRSEGLLKSLHNVALSISSKVIFEYYGQANKLFSNKQVKKYGQKFVTVYTGIELDRFSRIGGKGYQLDGFEDKDFIVAQIAYIDPRKNQLDFLKMALLVHHEYPNVKFAIVGDVLDPVAGGDIGYKRKVIDFITKNEMGDYVTFLGWRNDVPKILTRINLLVSASKDEGMPGIVREAMAMRIPVVATDAGGTAEAVKDGVTGFIVGIGDVEGLANRSIKLIKDLALRNKMGNAGRKRVEKLFSLERYVKSFQDIFEKAVEKS